MQKLRDTKIGKEMLEGREKPLSHDVKLAEGLELREVVITLVRDKNTKMEGLYIECNKVPPMELIGVLDMAREQAMIDMLMKSKPITDNVQRRVLEHGIPRPDTDHQVGYHG